MGGGAHEGEPTPAAGDMNALVNNRTEQHGAWFDPMLPTYSTRCRCPTCGKYFASTAAFDRHRTGAFNGGRRCRSEAEMLARGMAKAAGGHWITKPRPASLMPVKRVPCRARDEMSAGR